MGKLVFAMILVVALNHKLYSQDYSAANDKSEELTTFRDDLIRDENYNPAKYRVISKRLIGQLYTISGQISKIVSEDDANYVTMMYGEDNWELPKEAQFNFHFDKPEQIMDLRIGQSITIQCLLSEITDKWEFLGFMELGGDTYYFNFINPKITDLNAISEEEKTMYDAWESEIEMEINGQSNQMVGSDQSLANPNPQNSQGVLAYEEIKLEEPEPEEPEIFTVVEQQPEFPGGQIGLMRFIGENLNYPPLAQENGIEGTVVLRFIIDETGAMSDIRIIRDIGGGCGNEAVRLIKSMPENWQPGKQRGKPVRVYYTLPMRFKLE